MPNGTTKTSAADRKRRIVTGVVIMTALMLHASLWSIGEVPDDRALLGDEYLYWHGAKKLNEGVTWHPDALWPPLYPHFLATIFATGGAAGAIKVVQIFMLLAMALLLRDLTWHLTGSRFAGDVAAALTLVYPPLAAFAHYLWPEVLHVLLFTAALWILVRRPERPLWLLGAGTLLGLAILAKSLLGPFLPLLVMPLAVEGSLRDRARRILLVAIAIGVVIIPTVISNHQRSTGVVIANSLAFNLWVGLNERSRKNFVDPVVAGEWLTYAKSAPSFRERNAILWRKIKDFRQRKSVFEILRHQLGRQPFRLFDKDSFLTDMLPGGAIAASGRGYLQVPRPITRGLRGASYLMYAAILIGTVAGMVVCPQRHRRWLVIGLLFIAYNLALFLLIHVKSRYRVPLLPFFFLYSGCAAAWAAHKLGFNPDEAELWSIANDRQSWWAASAVALLLLFLAFGRSLV